MFALPFLDILKPGVWFFFSLIFHLPTFNFHGKEEKMLSALFLKPVLRRQLNWTHCVSQGYLPYSFPKPEKQNITWYRDPLLQTQLPSLSSNAGGNDEICRRYLWAVCRKLDKKFHTTLDIQAKCLHPCEYSSLFRYKAASKLLFGN